MVIRRAEHPFDLRLCIILGNLPSLARMRCVRVGLGDPDLTVPRAHKRTQRTNGCLNRGLLISLQTIRALIRLARFVDKANDVVEAMFEDAKELQVILGALRNNKLDRSELFKEEQA